MMRCKDTAIAFLLAISCASGAFAQTITYDGDNRIASVTDLDVNGTLYDLTTSYGVAINGASTPGTGDLAEADVDDAITAIVALTAGSTGGLASSLHFGLATQSGNAVDSYGTAGSITRAGAIPLNTAVLADSTFFDVGSATFGLGTFTFSPITSVPEPSTFAFAALLAVVGLIWVRRRGELKPAVATNRPSQ